MCNIPEDGNFQTHLYKNLKSHLLHMLHNKQTKNLQCWLNFMSV
jgi:hypothetical protein